VSAKVFVITAASTALILLLSSLKSKKKVGDKLLTKTKVKVHSLSFNGLTIRLDVILINPTEGTLTIKQPFIKVMFNEKEIATSQIENKEVEIPKFNSKPMDAIFLTVPATGLFTLGDGLLKLLLKGQAAQITAHIFTSIKLGNKFMDYDTKEVIQLKP
jgi:hypothetical protein